MENQLELFEKSTEEKEMIEIRLGTWNYNAGIVGFLKIIMFSQGVSSISEIRDVEFSKGSFKFSQNILENFEDKYFSYLIETYKKRISISRILLFSDFIKRHLNENCENFNDGDLDKLNNFIGGNGITGSFKQLINSNSYKSGYELFSKGREILEFDKDIKPIKLKKGEQVANYKEDIFKNLKKIMEVIEILNSDDAIKFLGAKNIMYTVIKNGWNGVSLLYPQTKEKNMYIDYKKYFIESAENYLNEEKLKYKYNCFSCERQIKDLSLDLSFLNQTGFDTNRKTSHVWNFTNVIAICPICKIIYSCIPAGFTYAFDRGIFINDTNSVSDILQINREIKDNILSSEESRNFHTYRGLINAIQKQNNNKMVYELTDIQVVRYESESYRFNILSKKVLKVIRDKSDVLNRLLKAGYKEINTNFSIYEEVIKRIFDNQQLFNYINRLLMLKLSNEKDAYFNGSHINGVLDINTNFLKEVGILEKNEKDLVEVARQQGYFMKKNYKEKNAENKLNGISYRLLNSLKTSNSQSFMDTLLNCYLYIGKVVPEIFINCLKEDELFKTVGYGFLIGLIDGEEYKKQAENQKKGGDE